MSGPPRKENALRRNPEHLREKTRKWRSANPEIFAESQRKSESQRTLSYQRNPAKYLLRVAKYRAAKTGAEFTITEQDIVVPDTCPILGVPISVLAAKDQHGASLDRVDNTKGYVPGNVRVISRRANRMKGDLSMQDLETLMKYMKGEL